MPAKMIKNLIPLPKGDTLVIYASPKVSKAVEEVKEDLTLYKGVRFAEIVAAAYAQGLKDGAKNVFEKHDEMFASLRSSIPHRPPGRPRRRSSKKKR